MPRSSKSQPSRPTGPRLVRKTASAPPVQPDITHQQIAMRAYELFQREGGLHGRHVDHWLRAERELREFAQEHRTAAARARG